MNQLIHTTSPTLVLHQLGWGIPHSMWRSHAYAFYLDSITNGNGYAKFSVAWKYPLILSLMKQSSLYTGWPVSHYLQNILLQHWYVNDLIKLGCLHSSVQFIVLTVKSEHEHPLCPFLFKRYFFHSRCKDFHRNTTTHRLNDFIHL